MKKKLLAGDSACIRRLYLILLSLLCVLSVAEASSLPVPQATITGRVTDDTNAPLPGVNVLLKGTSQGTTTDIDGRYTLTVPPGDGTILVFSFIGYASIEETVDNRTTVNVVLRADVQNLHEVVVIGYQTVEKKDLTGAVSVISPEASNRLTSNSLAEIGRAHV